MRIGELWELGLSELCRGSITHGDGWGHSLALRAPHHPVAPRYGLSILSQWRMRFTEKTSNFLDNEEEQKREGTSASDIPGDIPPAGIPLAPSGNHGGFGSFPAPAAVGCDKGEGGGLQK